MLQNRNVKIMLRYVVLSLFLLAGFHGPTAFAVETKVFRDETFEQFNQGESTGTELLATGRLQVGPSAHKLDETGEGVIWKIAVDPADDSAFYSTGHSGKVYKHIPGKKPELWADLPQVEAIALAIDPKGALLVGASPGGVIYRVAKANEPKIYFETGEKYVWDMIFDRNGMLYAATGPNGKVYRIRGERNGEVLYDSDATNIMCLGFDSEGTLIAGTQGRGYALKIDRDKTASVMYAASEDEIRSIVTDPTGNIYIAVNSARTASVFDAAKKDEKDEASKASTDFGASLSGNSTIIQIQPSGFVTRYWQSPEGPVHSVVADNKTSSLLVAAGTRGKIYRVSTVDASHSVVVDAPEPLILTIVENGDGFYFGTANKANLYELQTSASVREATFASRAFNAGSTVKWGNLFYDGDETSGTDIMFQTRTGNTNDPLDGTWSEWAEAKRVGTRIVQVTSPVAQYLQYKVIIRSPAGANPVAIDRVQAFYVQRNAPPIIRNIEIQKIAGPPPGYNPYAALAQRLGIAMPQQAPSTVGGSSASATPPSAAPTPAPTATAATASATPATTPAGPAAIPVEGSNPTLSENSQRLIISWDAHDPNGDRLRYKLMFKGEDETDWKLIEENLTQTKFLFSTEAIPDGKYRVQVEATDSFENAETSASTVNLESRIYTVDNSPPTISVLQGEKISNEEFEITFTVYDEVSIIAAAEYNLNAAKEWRALSPEDGIFDLNRESFRVRVKPGDTSKEHTLSIRVYDQEGNSRIDKVLLR